MFPKDKWKLRSMNWFSNYPEFKNLIQHQLSIKAVISSKYGLLLCVCVCVCVTAALVEHNLYNTKFTYLNVQFHDF